MKKILWIVITLNALLALGVGTLYLLAETHPLAPGGTGYALQHWAEQLQVKLAGSAEQKGYRQIALAERRLVDLAQAGEGAAVAAAAEAFDQALETALAQVTGTPESSQGKLQARLELLLRQAELVVTAIEAGENGVALAELTAKVSALAAIGREVPEETAESVPAAAPLAIDPVVISFLGQAVEHEMYPLEGAHETAECLACHQGGEYANTAAECSSCHQYRSSYSGDPDVYRLSTQSDYLAEPAALYPEHFAGECEECHTAENWQPVAFDHDGVAECTSCHGEEAPGAESSWYEAHQGYPGQCELCHRDVASWETITYEHGGVIECESCHASETPAGHYEGACQRCHTGVEDWQELIFDHIGYDDCESCHSAAAGHFAGSCATCHSSTSNWTLLTFSHVGLKDCASCHERPAQHYGGACANCHFTDGWKRVSFDHSRYPNCTSCHEAPEGHYPGKCTTCHQTNTDWDNGTLTHIELVDCVSCHLEKAPAGHWQADCQKCHNTNDWQQIAVDHTGYSECLDCHEEDTPANHYDGQCSRCHNTQGWQISGFDHTDYTDCLDCHAAPGEHYNSECARCHNTSDWAAVSFDHTGYSDCIGCHAAPGEHYDGQCSNCHNTSDWFEISFDHAGYDTCQSCHETPAGHWPGQCIRCHTDTEDWLELEFDHTTYNDCRACHAEDRPAQHPNGQCSKCHVTTYWVEPTLASGPSEGQEPGEAIHVAPPRSYDKAETTVDGPER